MPRTSTLADGVALLGSGLAAAGAGTALANWLTAPRLRTHEPYMVPDTVAVCVPARDEQDNVAALVADLRAQRGIPRLRILILDDDSADATADVARAAGAGDSRVTVHQRRGDPPPGWTGKAAACHELSRLTGDASVLVFIDADVRLHPDAVAAAVRELRDHRAALVSPWPAQIAVTPAERLVQPLLAWSWASTLPVAVANATSFPSMGVACGQFMVFDAPTYHVLGGHAAVAASPTEDLGLARLLRRRGERTRLVLAGPLARCRMYTSRAAIVEGYSRWLWSAYGGRAGSAGVAAYLLLAYLVPPLGLLSRQSRRVAALGVASALASRTLARALETGPPEATDLGGELRAHLADGVAHPAAILAYLGLSMRSHRAHRTGTLTWKRRRSVP